jgi:hypothetical protein
MANTNVSRRALVQAGHFEKLFAGRHFDREVHPVRTLVPMLEAWSCVSYVESEEK